VRDCRDVSFCYNGQNIDICIKAAYIFPQAYPAVYSLYEKIKLIEKAYIVDIGGYTTDVLRLRYGKLDLECCYSLEFGVIKLFSRVVSTVASQLGGTIEEADVRNVLSGKETMLNDDMCKTIMQVSEDYAASLINILQTNDIDLSINSVFFVGGGAILLESFLEQSEQVKKAEFVLDTLANAKGYRELAKAITSKQVNG